MSGGSKKYAVRRSFREAKTLNQPHSKLSSLDLEITERCNNNCLHCGINLPRDEQSAITRELSTAKICSIFQEAADLGCLTIRITGGEPLLRRDFQEIYLFARKCGLKVLLFTNATLITASIAKLFKEIPPLEQIEITMYGMTPQSCHAVTRNPGSYAETQTGIQHLLENRIPFTLKFAALPSNQEDIGLFLNYYRELFPGSTDPSLVQFFNPRVRRDSTDKNRVIAGQRVPVHRSIEFFQEHLPGYLAGLPQFLTKFSGPQGLTLFGCDAGMHRGCVDAYGGFSPCLLLKDGDCSFDLKTGSIEKALASFFPDIRQRQATDPKYLERCAHCFLKSLCEQCPARSWMEHGVLDKPVDYYCELAHAQARHLGLLDACEYAWTGIDWQERMKNRFNAGSPVT